MWSRDFAPWTFYGFVFCVPYGFATRGADPVRNKQILDNMRCLFVPWSWSWCRCRLVLISLLLDTCGSMNRRVSHWVAAYIVCVSPYIAADTRVVLGVAVPFGMACFPAALASEAVVGDWAAAVTWCMSRFVALVANFSFCQP